MRKAVAIGIGIAIIVLVVGGMIAYSYTQLTVNLTDVGLHSLEWTTLTWSKLVKIGLDTLSGDWFSAAFELIDGINLNFNFDLTNNGLLPVYIPDVNHEILINGISIGKGHTNVDTTINPGQTERVTSFQNLQKTSLEPAAFSIVSAEGVMDIKVKGTANFQLFGLSIPVPFESSKQISIYDEIRDKINEEIGKNEQLQDDSIDTSLGETIVEAIKSIAKKIINSTLP